MYAPFSSWSRRWSLALCCGLMLSGRLQAQDKAQPEPVLVNLLNPCGVAIPPQGGFVFVSSRFGVYRYDPSYPDPAAHRAVVEIDGYPEPPGVLGKSPKYQVGPLGLAFLDKNHLIVAEGSRKPGDELVRVYQLPPKPRAANDWIKEEASLYTLGPIKAGKESAKGENRFYGVAVGAGAIWVSCGGDETKGWVAKAEVIEGKPGELKPVIATVPAAGAGMPGPLTFSPDGKELIVGQMGQTDTDAPDSVLCFYDPANGSLKRKVKTGLLDVSGLAYSPKTGKLYATDFAWKNSGAGGLFELEISGDTAKTTRIVALERPSALAFDQEGRLYVTTFGSKPANQPKAPDPGQLLYLRPGY
jgi:DNA-binding beta-propeller fold protein YncE